MTTKRIALFGLSANPPTGLSGHQGVVRLLTHCGQFDEVWVLPVYAHIYSSKRHLLVDFEDRFRMCELAFLPEATESCSVSISRLENEVAEECLAIHGPEFRVGTVDLLEYLHNHYSVTIDRAEHKYYFVVAMDALCDIAAGKWKNVERILELSHLAVLNREGYSSSDAVTQDFLHRKRDAILHVKVNPDGGHQLGEISSTLLRSLLGQSNSILDENVIHPAVVDFIKNRGLYNTGTATS